MLRRNRQHKVRKLHSLNPLKEIKSQEMSTLVSGATTATPSSFRSTSLPSQLNPSVRFCETSLHGESYSFLFVIDSGQLLHQAPPNECHAAPALMQIRDQLVHNKHYHARRRAVQVLTVESANPICGSKPMHQARHREERRKMTSRQDS